MLPLCAARVAKVLLQELEEELADMSQEVQHLQKFSVDSLSFEVRKHTFIRMMHVAFSIRCNLSASSHM